MRGIFREKGVLGFFQVDHHGCDDEDDYDDDDDHDEDEDNNDNAVRVWFHFGVGMFLDTFASSSHMK